MQPFCLISKNENTAEYDSEIQDFVNHVDWAGRASSGASYYDLYISASFKDTVYQKEPAFFCLSEEVKEAIYSVKKGYSLDAYKPQLMKEDCDRVEAFSEIRALMMYNNLNLHTISIQYFRDDDVKFEIIRIRKEKGWIYKAEDFEISFLLTPSQNIRPLDYRDYVYIPSHYDRYFFKYVTKNVTGTGGI